MSSSEPNPAEEPRPTTSTAWYRHAYPSYGPGWDAAIEAGVDMGLLHGAVYLTKDFDVVAPLTVENCRRILAALMPHHPRFYQAIGKPPVTRTGSTG